MTADLRAAAQAANNGEWLYPPRDKDPTGGSHGPRFYADTRYIRLASPDRMLGLLDHVKRLEERGDRLADMAAQFRDGLRYPGQLTATISSWREAQSIIQEGAAALEAHEPAPSSMTGGVQSEKGRQP